MGKSWLLFLAFWTISLSLFAQAKIDSLLETSKSSNPEKQLKALLELGQLFHRNDPDSALVYINQGFEVAKKEDFSTEILSLLNMKGNILRDQGKFEEARQIYQKLFDLASKQQNNRAQAQLHIC